MFGRETRMLLRHYLEHGKSKSGLARELGVSRDTIHRWIRAGDLDRDLDERPVQYGPRRPVATKLDPDKPIVEARLTAFPELSAVRLLEEIRAAGYTGGLLAAERGRAAAAASSATGGGRALRDTGRAAGTSRLRRVPLPVGQALRAAGRARVLAPPVVSI
jgi:transposase-like protein